MNRMNLGCGYVMPDDWVNVDNVVYGDHVLGDVTVGLPFDVGVFDYVLMNHTLQMFTYNQHEQVLREVKRIMKPGATLRILVPDFDKALEAYRTANYDYFPIADELEITMDAKFARYLFWHGETRCAFTSTSLKSLLAKNGFKSIRVAEFGECELDSREEESLIMECKK